MMIRYRYGYSSCDWKMLVLYFSVALGLGVDGPQWMNGRSSQLCALPIFSSYRIYNMSFFADLTPD
jgi:hypothetical protein